MKRASVSPCSKSIIKREIGQASLGFRWVCAKHLLRKRNEFFSLRNHRGDFGFGEIGIGRVITADAFVVALDQVLMKVC